MNPYLLVCSFSALGLAACSGAADIPDTPDLRAVIENYERPTASLDATSAADALSTVPSLDELATAFREAKYVLGEDVDRASSSASNSTGSRIRLQGSIGLQIRCPGDRQNPEYDESKNGSISVTLAVAETRIRRSFAGVANACVLQGKLRNGEPVHIQLDGTIAFDLGNDIGIGSRWSGDLLAVLPGTLTVAGHEFRSISGRLTQGTFQYLVTFGDGKTAVLQLEEDGRITVRDRSGKWNCAEGQPCAN